MKGDERLRGPADPECEAHDQLVRAARCALADLLGLYLESCLAVDQKRTLVELYEALVAVGSDVSDYAAEYAAVKNDLAEIIL